MCFLSLVVSLVAIWEAMTAMSIQWLQKRSSLQNIFKAGGPATIMVFPVPASPFSNLFPEPSKTCTDYWLLVSVWRFQSKILGVTRSARNPTQHPLGASKPVTTAARGPNGEENIRQKLLTRTSTRSSRDFWENLTRYSQKDLLEDLTKSEPLRIPEHPKHF